MLALTRLAALVPALRAGRLSAVAAITAGQAPRAGHGYGAHRLAGRLALPRPVSIGLAAPFTRPARSAVTLAAVTFGLTAVVLAVGLDTSIAKINAGANQGQRTQMRPALPPAQAAAHARQQQAIAAALRAQPGTLGYLAEAHRARGSTGSACPALGSQVPVTAFGGNAAVARLGHHQRDLVHRPRRGRRQHRPPGTDRPGGRPDHPP